MPLYVTLFKFTDQGRKTIKDSPKRVRAAMAQFQKAGVKFLGVYYTSGRYDLVAIAEAPNDEVALALGLGTASQGNVVTETLHAYSVDEVEKIVSKLP